MKFKTDFDNYIKRIFVDKKATAWARYADGERMILQNITVSNGTQATEIDKWKYNNNTIFSKDLEETLHNNDEDYIYAISCRCCDPVGEVYYKNIIRNKNISFANLWINSNFKPFREVVCGIKEDVVMIANYEGKHKQYPFPVKKILFCARRCL